MNLHENIDRIQSMMGVISENDNNSKITKLIDSVGLMTAINAFGGYDELVSRYGNDVISRDKKIEFIKEFYHENEEQDISLYLGDFDISPIHFYQDKKVEKQIEFIDENGVFVDVYSKTNFNAWIEVYTVPYEELPENILDEIFSILIYKS